MSDVTKLQGFGVELIAYMTNTIGEDMTVGILSCADFTPLGLSLALCTAVAMLCLSARVSFTGFFSIFDNAIYLLV